jgi:hypothetical protein
MSGSVAYIVNGRVAEIVPPLDGFPLAERFTPTYVAACVDIPAGTTVSLGDSYASGAFGPPPAPPTPSLAQQAEALLAGGVTLTVTGSLTLTALFPTDASTQKHLSRIEQVVNTTGKFPNDAATWPVAASVAGVPGWHALTSGQFKAVATAISNFIAPAELIALGFAGTMPSASADVTAP